MLYCPITSGSKGNCHLIKGDKTVILIDAGTSAKNLECQLSTLGVSPCDLSAIAITHEHIDHIAALDVLVRRSGLPIYCNYATMQGIIKRFPSLSEKSFKLFTTDEGFFINELEILPFKTPHDAAESVGYTVACGKQRIAVATDIGHMTPGILKSIEGVQLVAIESNHDQQMLMQGPYPFALKRRILGQNGHLSNAVCGQTLARMLEKGLRQAVLCHLSQENNTPELAYSTVQQCLLNVGCKDLPVDIARQDKRGGVYTVV